MRALLDTNVLVAAFVSRGHCNELLEHCVRRHRLVTSPDVLEELGRVLVDKLGFPATVADDAVELVRSEADVVEPVELSEEVSRDPDDDRILAAAVAGGCDCLVTGDGDLLVLDEFRGIPVLSPSAFWEFESRG